MGQDCNSAVHPACDPDTNRATQKNASVKSEEIATRQLQCLPASSSFAKPAWTTCQYTFRVCGKWGVGVDPLQSSNLATLRCPETDCYCKLLRSFVGLCYDWVRGPQGARPACRLERRVAWPLATPFMAGCSSPPWPSSSAAVCRSSRREPPPRPPPRPVMAMAARAEMPPLSLADAPPGDLPAALPCLARRPGCQGTPFQGIDPMTNNAVAEA